MSSAKIEASKMSSSYKDKTISGGVQVLNDNGLYAIKAKDKSYW